MGKNAQLAKLEARITELEAELKQMKEIRDFIKQLAEMDDYTILNNYYGMVVTHDPVAAAKVFLEKLSVKP